MFYEAGFSDLIGFDYRNIFVKQTAFFVISPFFSFSISPFLLFLCFHIDYSKLPYFFEICLLERYVGQKWRIGRRRRRCNSFSRGSNLGGWEVSRTLRQGFGGTQGQNHTGKRMEIRRSCTWGLQRRQRRFVCASDGELLPVIFLLSDDFTMDWLIDWLIAWLFDWFVVCLTDCPAACLLDWLIDSLSAWLIVQQLACLIDWLAFIGCIKCSISDTEFINYCTTKWVSIRNSFNRFLLKNEKKPSGSGRGETTVKPYKFAKQLAFLRQHIKSRRYQRRLIYTPIDCFLEVFQFFH